ncbi:MAG: efflux RND transporter periplasmic adaptor subunit [Bacteroidales bacterium]|jgi:Cu(I)/Ag(I) efflux system membrane fusion protein|nr:efflux RND transporter periplasmic adaptor subunit [Bacteroidales bacterium]
MKTKHIMLYVLLFAAGIFLGWLLFGSRHEAHEHSETEAGTQVWTCSMHPQIRRDKPGKCPLCAMDLIPLTTSGEADNIADPDVIVLSPEAAALANIQTTKVSRTRPVKEVHLYGTIQPDERRLHSLSSHVNGRIEKLSVHYAGETLHAGQVVATVWSPDLQTAQQELLEALKLQASQPELLIAAREKLRIWKLTDAQINEIERTEKASPLTDIVADNSGIVVAKRVEQGDYIGQGSVLFDLADFSVVWALFDAYETDLPYLKTGDNAKFTTPALPGKTFQGKIAFIDPTLDPVARTAKVRVETANPQLELKPGMYANAAIHAALTQYANEIVLPKTAVLWTGKRSIVYVKQQGKDMPSFALREIELGPSLGDACVVLAGISDNEEVVTNGIFAIDASAQLEGKRSMMNTNEKNTATNHATLIVQGLCNMCKTRIETAARSVAGVSSAVWETETQQLHLTSDAGETPVDAVSQTIARAGHDTEKHKADDNAYNDLPDCCKYRK